MIGYDRRFLSREFAERVAEVASGNGIRVGLGTAARLPPRPWAVHEVRAGGGVMITASHNPSIYNGFKFKEAFGGSARPATTRALEELIAANIEAELLVLAISLAEAPTSGLCGNDRHADRLFPPARAAMWTWATDPQGRDPGGG